MMGRFQPFHLGHLDLAKQILSECNEVVIAITSSQFNYLKKDPYTAGERIEMIHNSINESELDLSRCFIVGIENQFNVATWASYLKAALPHFDKVYSGNEYVTMLLADSGIDVAAPKFLDRAQYNSTRIRNMIINDEDWQDLVPKAVADLISKIDGQNRLKTISTSDTKPTEY